VETFLAREERESGFWSGGEKEGNGGRVDVKSDCIVVQRAGSPVWCDGKRSLLKKQHGGEDHAGHSRRGGRTPIKPQDVPHSYLETLQKREGRNGKAGIASTATIGRKGANNG